MSDDACSLGEAECVRETDAAILVELDSGDKKWLPKSIIHDDSEVWKEGQTGELVVDRWFAEKEKLV